MGESARRRLSISVAGTLLALGLALGIAFALPSQARADGGSAVGLQAQSLLKTQSDNYVSYTLNTEYEGYVDEESISCFTFKLTKKQHVWATLKSDYGALQLSFEDKNGNTVSTNSNTLLKKNSQSKWNYTYSHSCTLNAGTYYLIVDNDDVWENSLINLVMDAEDIITLGRGSISSLSSPAGGALKVKTGAVRGAIGYQYKLATSSSFSGASIVTSPSTTLTKTGLKKGTYYYVTARPYAVYSDGHQVYGSWSRVQAIYVKKLGNAVTISTTSKALKKKSIKKKGSRSFNVIADDLVGAPLTYKLTSIPKKAKKYVSIGSNTGKVTVKKGIKRGKYKLKLKVTAKATASYNSASKTKTLTLKIK